MNIFKKNSPKCSLHSIKNSLLVLLFLSLAEIAFGQTALKYVPSTADVVITVNLQNLDKKVNLAQLQQYDFYQALLKEMNKTPGLENDTSKQEYLGKLLTDPVSLGFDTKEPFYFFVEKVGFDTYLTFVQKMGDKVRYESAVQVLKKEEYLPNLTEQDALKIWQKDDELFAWNEEVVINVIRQAGINPDVNNWDYGDAGGWEDPVLLDSAYVEEGTDWEEIIEQDTPIIEQEEVAEDVTTMPEADTLQYGQEGDDMFDFDDLEWAEEPDTAASAWAVKVLNKDFLQPITRNDRYAMAKGKTDDVHFWIDYGFFTETNSKTGGWVAYPPMTILPQNGFAQAMGGMMDVFYGDTYLSMGLNFEDGRMAIRSQMFFNDDMKKFYSRALDTKFNKKFLRYVKGGDEMFGYFYLNYNINNTIEESKALLYKMFDATPQYGEMAADMMKILGIFIDEDAVGNLLKGDLMLAVSGIQTVAVTTQTYDYDADFNFTTKDTTMMKEMPIFTALASYGNGKDIQKFIDLGLHSKVLTQEGSFYRMALPGMDGMEFFLAKHDGLLIFTNNAYLMRQNLENGFAKKLRLPKNHKKRLCESASVVYWNIPNTLRAAAGSQSGSNIGMMGYLNNIGKEFYSMEMTSSKKVGNSVDSEMFLNMTNKDTNALQQFFNFVNDMYLEVIGGAKI